MLRNKLITYGRATRLFAAGALSEAQAARFNKAQLEGLEAGLSIVEVDHDWFDHCHVSGARLRLPKEKFLRAEFTRQHVDALSRDFDFARIQDLSAGQIAALTQGLNHSQSWALRKFKLTREQVEHSWFDRRCLPDLEKGQSYADVRLKALERNQHSRVSGLGIFANLNEIVVVANQEQEESKENKIR